MIAAVIPVKRLSEAKSRLASRLSAAERLTLVTGLLARSVAVLQEVRAIERIALATEERTLVEGWSGVEWLPDRGGLNATLAHAVSWARTVPADSLLILPSDLPLLCAHDVRALLAAAPTGPGITIAPTRDGGTGALLLTPPNVIVPAFGPESFTRHRDAARAAGVGVSTVARHGLAQELDTPDDLTLLERVTPAAGCALP